MCIQQKLLTHCLTELFNDEKEMIGVLESIISLLKVQHLPNKIFLKKIEIKNSTDFYVDTGFFSDTLTIHSPDPNQVKLAGEFIPAIQNSKLQTILLLFTTLKPHYREELLQQIKEKLP